MQGLATTTLMTEYEDVPIEFECNEPLPPDLPLMVNHTELVGKVVSCRPLEVSLIAGSRAVQLIELIRVVPVKGERDRLHTVVRSLPSFIRMYESITHP